MSKSRTFGQDVRVRLYDSNHVTPYIIDFDSIEVESLNESLRKKAIGKKIWNSQTINSGYKVRLSRAKRDNYNQSIQGMIDLLINNGYKAPKFCIEEIVTHPYAVDAINPYFEMVGESLLNLVPNNNLLTNVANQAVNKTLNNPATKGALSFGSKLAGSAAGLLLGVFKEHYLYNSCTIEKPKYEHKVMDTTIEVMEFTCAEKINLNDLNAYDDSYINSNIIISALNDVKKELEGRLSQMDLSNVIDQILTQL